MAQAVTIRASGALVWRWWPAVVALAWVRVEGQPWWRTRLVLRVAR